MVETPAVTTKKTTPFASQRRGRGCSRAGNTRSSASIATKMTGMRIVKIASMPRWRDGGRDFS
jgi:hypothetical protein